MKEQVYWTSPVGTHDDFGFPIEDYFVDGKTRHNSPGKGRWAIMNIASFNNYGEALGTGYGQKYHKQPDGRWLKVEG